MANPNVVVFPSKCTGPGVRPEPAFSRVASTAGPGRSSDDESRSDDGGRRRIRWPSCGPGSTVAGVWATAAWPGRRTAVGDPLVKGHTRRPGPRGARRWWTTMRGDVLGRLGGIALEQRLVLTGHTAVGQDEAQDRGGGDNESDGRPSEGEGRQPPHFMVPPRTVMRLGSLVQRFSTGSGGYVNDAGRPSPIADSSH